MTDRERPRFLFSIHGDFANMASGCFRGRKQVSR